MLCTRRLLSEQLAGAAVHGHAPLLTAFQRYAQFVFVSSITVAALTHACPVQLIHSFVRSFVCSFIHPFIRLVLPALVIPCVLARVPSSLQLGLLGLRQLMATAQTLWSSTGLWQEGSSRLHHALSKAGYGGAARLCYEGQSSCKQGLD